MSAPSFLAGIAVCCWTVSAVAQRPESEADPPGWRGAGGDQASVSAASSAKAERPDVEPTAAPRRTVTRVSTGNGRLPNEHGQLWREYDISPYTLRVDSTARPEQAVVDWILRETGYEAWHGEVVTVLSATRRRLLVYHTPQMQAIVAGVVDRFVSSQGAGQSFGLRLVTVDHPNWRAPVRRLLKPVQVQTPGVEAWLVEKEDAAVLLDQLGRRSDYREHNSPHVVVHNGQSVVISATRARHYVRSVLRRPEAWPGFEPQTAVVDEGFSLEFSPLLSVDGATIDAVLRCNIDQVEKMVPVTVEVPTVVAPRQRTQIEVPQMAQFRFHERFRWPADQVLLVGLGVVPLPVPSEGKPLVPGLPLPLPKTAPRADVLVFVEPYGPAEATPRLTRSLSPNPPARY
ncbi:MAG TPA: hypothetical protein EYH34_08700 [Planctomycetes bacterium]|nr:hypothetical protein [Planctomycetota bacterium]